MNGAELQKMFDGLQGWLDNPTTDRWEVWVGASIFYIYHPNKTRPASATPPAAIEGRRPRAHHEACGNCHQPVCVCRNYTDAQVDGVCGALQDEIAKLRERAEAAEKGKQKYFDAAKDAEESLYQTQQSLEAAEKEQKRWHDNAVDERVKRVAAERLMNDVSRKLVDAEKRVAELQMSHDMWQVAGQAAETERDQLRAQLAGERPTYAGHKVTCAQWTIGVCNCRTLDTTDKGEK